MADQLSVERLQMMTNNLIESLSSDEFLSRLREVRNAPEGERMKRAAALLSVDALREAGVPIPPTMRVSSRFFEENPPAPPATLLKELQDSHPDFIQELRDSQPAVYEKLVALANPPEMDTTGSPAARITGEITPFGVCGGGGVSGTCACAGQPS